MMRLYSLAPVLSKRLFKIVIPCWWSFWLFLASWMFEQDEKKNNCNGVISYDY